MRAVGWMGAKRFQSMWSASMPLDSKLSLDALGKPVILAGDAQQGVLNVKVVLV
jgi:hypothetical protein